MSEVWGVTMVKDEADVIEQTLRHMHGEGIAGIVCLDNGSTDGTRAILDRLADEWPGWLRIVDDPEVGYWQAAKMTSAMRMAADLGATWVLPFDADEIWVHASGRPLGDAILIEGDAKSALGGRLYHHLCTGLDPEPDEPGIDDPFTRMPWRQPEPAPLPKVCVRADACQKIEMGNHGARLKWGQVAWSELVVHHFPYRSPEQLVRKVRNGAAAYAATTLAETTGQHWREMGRALESGGEPAIHAWYYSGFFYPQPAEQGLIYDPVVLS